MRQDRPFQKPRRMVAQGVTVSEGRRYVVCVDPTTAEVVQAAISSQGGGNSFVQWPVNVPREPTSTFAISPEESGAAEVWVAFDRDQSPIVLATTSPSLSAWLQDESPDLIDGDIHPGAFGPQDLVIANGNGQSEPSMVVLGKDNSINLLSAGSIRIQVPNGFTARVSKDDDGGSAVVRFEPTQDAFNRVIDKLNDVGRALSTLYTLTSGISGTDVANPVAGQSYAYQAEPGVGEEIASKTLFVPYDDEPGNAP